MDVQCQLEGNGVGIYKNKKVLLCERKRHTAGRIAALSLDLPTGGNPHPVLTGEYPHLVPRGSTPSQSQWGVPPFSPDRLVGTPI